MPALANAAYAAVMAISVTSPEPSASEGTPGTDSMPKRSAVRRAVGMPMSINIPTAAELLDNRSAVLIVMGPLPE